MKGIVVEIKGKQAIVLTDDGIIRQTINESYRTGQEMNIMEPKKNKNLFLRYGVSIAAALMVFAGGAFVYADPVGYVSLDVNPSIEYSINTFDRVIEVKALNEDGEKLLASLNLENLTIEEAVKRTTAALIEAGYITADQSAGIVIATFMEEEEEAVALAQKIQEDLSAFVEEEGETVEVVSEAVGFERVQEAKMLGVTAGKLNLVQKLFALSGEEADPAKLEEWLGKSVKEINKETKALRKAQKEEMDGDLEDDDDSDLEDEDSDLDDDDSLVKATEQKKTTEQNKVKEEKTVQKAEENKTKETKVKTEDATDSDVADDAIVPEEELEDEASEDKASPGSPNENSSKEKPEKDKSNKTNDGNDD
ncbi:MAG: anti-sigma factor domain-containing protein [Eubacteriales bacterium]|nr:anti-sigma factor domain-containing protein [Eubacteriales bacterium]